MNAASCDIAMLLANASLYRRSWVSKAMSSRYDEVGVNNVALFQVEDMGPSNVALLPGLTQSEGRKLIRTGSYCH